jgi:hypothetical protein
MDTPQLTADAEDRIVYVRPVDVADLPEEVRAQAPDANNLYAVHAANGDRLALVNGQKLAFVLARQNSFDPVHVH